MPANVGTYEEPLYVIRVMQRNCESTLGVIGAVGSRHGCLLLELTSKAGGIVPGHGLLQMTVAGHSLPVLTSA